jgi:hypothetical protein
MWLEPPNAHAVVRPRSAPYLLLLFAAALCAQEAPEFTIHSSVERVLLDVSVKDSGGGFVRGLSKDNFRVFEDGTPQRISDFAAGDIPVTVGIVVDQSSSMARKQGEVLTAALTFAKESNPRDEMFVIHFNETVQRGLPKQVLFTDNPRMLRDALMAGVPEGRTALYDAIDVALQQLDLGRQALKTLVVISDGGDNASKHKRADVLRLTEETSATSKLAQISGGNAFFPRQLDQIVPICRGIAKDIRNRYMLSYTPRSGNGMESIRRIAVQVRAPGHGRLIARTRTSYLYTRATEARR